MDLYSGNVYALIFFVYGLAFFTMGISAIQQSNVSRSNFPMLNAIKFLGIFGIVHGITEWVLMVIILDLYPGYHFILYPLSGFLNASSFAFLWIFGNKSLQYNGRGSKILNSIPFIVYLIWLVLFVNFRVINGENNQSVISMLKIMSRYLIGFPASVITVIAINKNARSMEKLKIKGIPNKIRTLAISFAIYGILAGIIVSKKSFFPANIINKELFQSLFYVPVELLRALTAVIITVEFIGVVQLIRWENNKKLDMLLQQDIAAKERKKLAQELHDVVIQNIFASGLQIEGLSEACSNPEIRENLNGIKENLNHTIFSVREFIASISSQRTDIWELRAKISDLVGRFSSLSGLDIQLDYNIPDIVMGDMSPKKLTQVYLIIQEAVSNAVKHSKANKINVKLDADLEFLIATVTDNGIGLQVDGLSNSNSFGLSSMKERVDEVGGQLRILSKSTGTQIFLSIPWEVRSEENKDTDS
jgi:two-component system, NarL family, sensor histidine kinase YdfH